jgi:Ser/Thr protein kinase RdoA (MazF antagonist)
MPAPPPDFAPFDRLVRAALPRWGIDAAAHIRMINHSENITYRVDHPQTGWRSILRLHRPGYHTDEAILSELAWQDALRREAGVETAQALAARDDSLLQVLSSAELAEPRRAVMFSFLDGAEPAGDDLLPAMEQLGEVTARLHRHARAWPRPAGFTRHAWDYETMLGARPIWGRWQDGIGIAGEALQQLGRLDRALRRQLQEFGSGPDRYGLIHADLRLANLLVDEGRVKVIDFDDCGGGWYLADYGAALSFIEDRPDVPDLTDAWLRGYRRVAPLGAAEERELPTFLLLRRLLLVAWLGSHADTDLARELGTGYTLGTCHLAETYLQRFG